MEDENHIICWRSILAGLLVSLLIYMILSALGAGIGGFTAAHVLDKNENGTALATGAAVWLGLSASVSLFSGGYFGVRYSKTVHKQYGSANGVVISALFFFVLLHGMGQMLGSLSAVTLNLDSGTVGASDAEAAARALGDAGWVLFVTLLVGLAAGIVGGYEGALGNLQRPFSTSK